MKGNALFTGRGNESMHDVMKRREQEFFTPMEILVIAYEWNRESHALDEILGR